MASAQTIRFPVNQKTVVEVKHSGGEWVIVHVTTDSTGQPTVSVVNRIFKGETAEKDCRKFTQVLNDTSRKDLMEVYLARKVGDDSSDGAL